MLFCMCFVGPRVKIQFVGLALSPSSATSLQLLAMSQRPRQETNVVAATCLGGPARLTGNFVLTDERTLRSDAFWQAHPKMTLVVNCIGFRPGSDMLVYPMSSAQSQKIYVETRNTVTLPVQFARAAVAVEAELEQGNEVLVHCRETFHRGPAIFAGLLKRLCGVDHQVDIP